LCVARRGRQEIEAQMTQFLSCTSFHIRCCCIF